MCLFDVGNAGKQKYWITTKRLQAKRDKLTPMWAHTYEQITVVTYVCVCVCVVFEKASLCA